MFSKIKIRFIVNDFSIINFAQLIVFYFLLFFLNLKLTIFLILQSSLNPLNLNIKSLLIFLINEFDKNYYDYF